MTSVSIIIDIIISMLASFVFWLLTFVVTKTKVVFSTTIEKSILEKLDDGSPIYRVRIMNTGKRDLVEVSYTAKLRIKDNGRIRSTYLCLGDEQTIPILKGFDKKKKKKYSTYLPGFYVKDVARNEFSKTIYPESIQNKAKTGTLVLDDLLKEFGDKIDITIFVSGNDRLTGARKMFTSDEYTVKDIVEGRFVKWNGLPPGLQTIINKNRIATKVISEIETIESVAVETYVDAIYVLNNTNPSAKEEFIEHNSLRKPNNSYELLDIDIINKKIERLENFLPGLGINNQYSGEMKADLMLLKHFLSALQFVKTNYEYLHSNDNDAEKRIIADKHRALNNTLYGLPQKEVFQAITKELTTKDSSAGIVFQPNDRLVNKFSRVISDYMRNILEFIPENQEVFSVEEACNISNKILNDCLHATELGWKAIVEPSSSFASVNQRDRLVKFPGKRSKGDYTRHDLRAIIAHEIGVHVNRALAANRIDSFALSLGLPYYETFEEGLAVAVEQVINGDDFKHPGFRHYLSIGLIEFEEMDFRDVYEKELKIYGYSDSMKRITFDSVQRAFRGTGELLNSKDLVYYNGTDLFWHYVEEMIDSPNFLTYLFERGKIDATRADHRIIADDIFSKSKDN